MKRAVVFLVLAAGIGTGVLAGDIQYFPDLALDTRADLHELCVEWYSKHLRAMGEPSLLAAEGDEDSQSYRFLWLRTFHHPIAVRLRVKTEGEGFLVATVLDGAGGYEPGEVKTQLTQDLKSDEVLPFLVALENIDFWELPGPDPAPGGLDGAQWVLEGVRDGKYHVVDRWTPDGGAYRDLCLMLVRLSGIEVDDVY